MAWSVSSNTEKYDLASAWFRKRVPMLKADFEKLVGDARLRAFTIAGVSRLELIQEVMGALDKSIAGGETLADFKKRVETKLLKAWGGTEPTGRLELIHRNAVQQAYNAGRYALATDPAVINVRPYWKFDAILDRRTSDVCRENNGRIMPANDVWWNLNYPPLHHRCRSSVRSLTIEQAGQAGFADGDFVNQHSPSPGFGFAPTPDTPIWQPEPNKFYPRLWAAFQVRLTETLAKAAATVQNEIEVLP